MAWTERYCSTAGGGAHDGTSEANAWTLAEAITGYAAGHRINVKAGTYSSGATNRSFATAGTTTAPVWWRGYTSTIGDLDAAPTYARTPGTDLPLFTSTTGYYDFPGAHNFFSNISFVTAQTAGSGFFSAVVGFHRCRFENTAANAGAYAGVCYNNGVITFSQCWFKATTTATRVVRIQQGVGLFTGCAFNGGGHQVEFDTYSGSGVFAHCSFRGAGDCGIKMTVAGYIFYVSSCTFRGATNDGIRISAIPTRGLISSSLFSRNGGYGINNNSGANTAFLSRTANAFDTNTSGAERGFGDFPSLVEITESSDPCTSSTDLSLVSGAASKATGMPGLFEAEAFLSYLDIGAVQRQELGGRPPRIMQIHGGNRSEY